jgi:predicted methyltransferase
MAERKPAPPTPAQLQALATFAATHVMTTDNRVINALIRRGLVQRTGDNAYALTEAGRTLANSPAGRKAGSSTMKCCVEGCANNVWGEYDMCGKHFDMWVNGRLKPKSQGAA